MFEVNYLNRSKKQETVTLETREELFSFLNSLMTCGGGPYYRWGGTLDQAIADMFADVAMNPNDKKGWVPFEASSSRNLRVTENGRGFDPRMFRQEILRAKPYKALSKPKGESHSHEGYGKVYPRRPKFRGTLAAHELEREILREWGLRPTVSNKRWWWYGPDCTGGERSWKGQTKSRKQWGKKKPNPIKRGYAQHAYPEEAELVED